MIVIDVSMGTLTSAVCHSTIWSYQNCRYMVNSRSRATHPIGHRRLICSCQFMSMHGHIHSLYMRVVTYYKWLTSTLTCTWFLQDLRIKSSTLSTVWAKLWPNNNIIVLFIFFKCGCLTIGLSNNCHKNLHTNKINSMLFTVELQ